MYDQTWSLLLRDQLAWPLTGHLRDRVVGLHLHAHQQAWREPS